MKLKVENPNGIVTAAFVERSALSFSLIINTKNKGVRPDGYGTSDESVDWDYWPEDDKLPPDVVSLVAESEEDKEVISRIHFELLSKNQLWILLPVRGVYEPAKEEINK